MKENNREILFEVGTAVMGETRPERNLGTVVLQTTMIWAWTTWNGKEWSGHGQLAYFCIGVKKFPS
jgi:hypothetical protein